MARRSASGVRWNRDAASIAAVVRKGAWLIFKRCSGCVLELGTAPVCRGTPNIVRSFNTTLWEGEKAVPAFQEHGAALHACPATAASAILL